MRPRIGITADFATKPNGAVVAQVGTDYTDAIRQAGGQPLVIPFGASADELEELAADLDGLLLTGGPDVAPRHYGEEPRVGLGSVAPERDYLELTLLNAALHLDKPVLGVCRGVQVMNAAFGGTLYQDLPREWPGDLQHAQNAPRDHVAHQVQVVPGTLLATILGSETVYVNTFHHQAVNRLAARCIVNARSGDGLIEGLEHPDYRFVLGVQWHPENLFRKEESALRLFAAFVESASMRP